VARPTEVQQQQFEKPSGTHQVEARGTLVALIEDQTEFVINLQAYPDEPPAEKEVELTLTYADGAEDRSTQLVSSGWFQYSTPRPVVMIKWRETKVA
jgi:hypothetical protein